MDVGSENNVKKAFNYPKLEIGVRVKPVVKIHGKWSGSVGVSSKFGLTVGALYRIAREYKWLASRITQLHMHPGSQVPRLRDLAKYFDEVMSTYEELREMGFENLEILNPGGGLAYPYLDVREGTEESPDYTVVEYFKELLSRVARASHKPKVVYEGGRFIVASHRIVVAKVIDVRAYAGVQLSQDQLEHLRPITVGLKSTREIGEVISRLKFLLIKLRQRAHVDNRERILYEDLEAFTREEMALQIHELALNGKLDADEIMKERGALWVLTTPTKRFILEMSLFTDMPDAVLLGQYFQVVPSHRLSEKPDVLASLSDITCDSMGELAKFKSPGKLLKTASPLFTALDKKLIAHPGVELTLRGIPLHIPRPDENYYVVFLDTGAYQDTLATRHNLIPKAPEIIVDFNRENGGLRVELVRHEDYTQYSKS